MQYFDFLITWLGIGAGYVVALLCIVGGGYLAFVLGKNPLIPLSGLIHYAGLSLIALGIVLGAVNYGKSVGATACQEQRKAANYEARIEQLKKEAVAKDAAAKLSAEQAIQLASQNDEMQSQLNDYTGSVAKLKASESDCRRATSDDVRRLCELTGNAAPGCADTGRLRQKRGPGQASED